MMSHEKETVLKLLVCSLTEVCDVNVDFNCKATFVHPMQFWDKFI